MYFLFHMLKFLQVFSYLGFVCVFCCYCCCCLLYTVRTYIAYCAAEIGKILLLRIMIFSLRKICPAKRILSTK